VFAAMLARRGMTGPSPVFEGVGGYFKAVTRAPFSLGALGGRERPYKILECSIKRYPLGQYSQTVVQAALEARARIAAVDDIAEIRIETGATAIRLMAGDPEKWAPATRETADHSMPYTVAVALTYGGVDEHHFDDEYRCNPRLLALAQKVKVEVSEEANRRMPEAMLCHVTLVTTSGHAHTAAVEYHKGHWRNPMSESELEEKFRRLAARALAPAQTDRLLEGLWKFEELPEAGASVRLTVAG
jgi:2-methylcitrate dehydratase